MMVKLIKPMAPDSTHEVQIRWTSRSRLAETDPTKQSANHDPPDTEARKSQDPPVCVIGEESHNRGYGPNQSEDTPISGGADDNDEGDACAVCLARAPDCELWPCGHARCCRRCVVETVCTWRQEGPPRCALCRAPIHTMVFLE